MDEIAPIDRHESGRERTVFCLHCLAGSDVKKVPIRQHTHTLDTPGRSATAFVC